MHRGGPLTATSDIGNPPAPAQQPDVGGAEAQKKPHTRRTRKATR